jgi:hypothetical protein
LIEAFTAFLIRQFDRPQKTLLDFYRGAHHRMPGESVTALDLYLLPAVDAGEQ